MGVVVAVALTVETVKPAIVVVDALESVIAVVVPELEDELVLGGRAFRWISEFVLAELRNKEPIPPERLMFPPAIRLKLLRLRMASGLALALTDILCGYARGPNAVERGGSVAALHSADDAGRRGRVRELEVQRTSGFNFRPGQRSLTIKSNQNVSARGSCVVKLGKWGGGEQLALFESFQSRRGFSSHFLSPPCILLPPRPCDEGMFGLPHDRRFRAGVMTVNSKLFGTSGFSPRLLTSRRL